MSKIYLRKSIDLALRNELDKNFILKDDFSWNLIVYLLYEKTDFAVDVLDLPIRLSDERLAVMAGKEEQFSKGNFRGKKLLEKFSGESCLPLWTEYKNEAGATSEPLSGGWTKVRGGIKSRRYLRVNPVWPKDVVDTLDRVIGGQKTERVYITTGKPYTRKKKDKEVDKTKKDLLPLLAQSKSKIATDLNLYLNEMTKHQFTRIINLNMADARKVALMEKDSKGQLAILEFIENELPQPIYKPVDNSPRLFAIGQSICGLQRHVRKTLTKGWHEADLRNAQLAIVAERWNITKLKKFLLSGESFWTYLFREMDWTPNEYDKDFLKKVTYSLVFGALADPKGKCLSNIALLFGKEEKDLVKFLNVPLIKSILRKRSEQFRKIRKDKGAFDYFGNWIELSKDKGHTKRSILAQVAQSVELGLLEPVIEWFIKNKGKKNGSLLLLWQHDGFSFSVCPAFLLWVTKVLKNLVAKKGRELGIVSTLEIEKFVPNEKSKKGKTLLQLDRELQTIKENKCINTIPVISTPKNWPKPLVNEF